MMMMMIAELTGDTRRVSRCIRSRNDDVFHCVSTLKPTGPLGIEVYVKSLSKVE